MGFSNALVSRSLGPPLQLWFLVTLASTAFFNSPRGRWWLKVLHELGFLVVYQLVLFQPAPSNDFRYLHLSLLLYTTGNLVEAAQYALIKYRGNLTQYASDFFQALDVLLNAVLFAFMANYTLRSFGVLPASWPGEGGVSLAFATTAVFVWIRCLRVLVPLYRKLGPMLTTLTRMIGEVRVYT